MSVSAGYLTPTVTMAAVAREVGVDALVNMSQMTVSQMSIQTTTPSPQQRQHGLSELRESDRARRGFFPRRCPNGCSLFVVFTRGGAQASARACETVWSTVMAKFLFIYRESTVSPCKPSPEEMQALQVAWYAWMQKFSSAIVPGGDGLKHTGRLVKAGLVTDGPYVEAKEIVVSFGLIQADNYDAAVAIARECPPGHTIEIRELAGYA
jgi:hypothetical protein